MASFLDFSRRPGEYRKLHVNDADVDIGALIDQKRKELDDQAAIRRLMASALSGKRYPATPAPSDEEREAWRLYEKAYRDRGRQYGERAPRPTGSLSSGLEILKHAFMRDEEAKDMAKVGLMGAGLAGGMAAPLLVPSAPVLSAAAINALTGIPANVALGSPEGVPQDAIAGAAMGAAAKTHPAMAIPAALASYAATNIPEAEAGGLSALKALLPGLYSDFLRPGVIKPKGGGWKPGVVENALSTIMQRRGGVGGEVLQTPDNRWIEGPLTKYIKTRMASPEDEVRKLAEQGILHYTPNQPPGFDSALVGKRASLGQMPGGEAVSPLAQQWEGLADKAVRIGPSATYPGQTEYSISGSVADRAHHLGTDLGMSHLVDELRNALRPDSDLPRHLQLSPEAMQNLSMEKAVRRVADINAWRAAQKVEANRKLAEQAGIVREYAENNPKGLRWVELKAQADDEAARQALADQLKYEGDVMGHCVGGYCDDVLSGQSRIFSLRDARGEPHVTVEVAPEPGLFEGYDRSIDLVEDVIERADPEELKVFEDGLERDYGLSLEEFVGSIADDWRRRIDPLEPYDLGMDLLRRISPKAAAKLEEESTAGGVSYYINQIKGKQNEAPIPEYLPFVQDFVRNSPLGQPWGSINDFGNTGLIDVEQFVQPSRVALGPEFRRELSRIYPTATGPVGGVAMSSDVLGTRRGEYDLLKEALGGKSGYLTKDELLDILRAAEPKPIEAGYIKKAAGGRVVVPKPGDGRGVATIGIRGVKSDAEYSPLSLDDFAAELIRQLEVA